MLAKVENNHRGCSQFFYSASHMGTGWRRYSQSLDGAFDLSGKEGIGLYVSRTASSQQPEPM